MITESITIRGELEILVLDDSNRIKDRRHLKNLVVATGKDFIASRMSSNASVVMSHMALGTANVTPTTGQSLLLGEAGRVALGGTSVTNNTITYTATFPAGTATGTLAEAGVFNGASANTGTMLCRTRFNEVNKGASDIIVITWNVTVE